MTEKKLADRKNDGKIRLGLVPVEATISTARALTFGTAKYDIDDWRNGLPYMELIDSLERHIAAFKMGEDVDPDSGLPVIDLIGANTAFLQAYVTSERDDLDNRPKCKHQSLTMPVASLKRMEELKKKKLEDAAPVLTPIEPYPPQPAPNMAIKAPHPVRAPEPFPKHAITQEEALKRKNRGGD